MPRSEALMAAAAAAAMATFALGCAGSMTRQAGQSTADAESATGLAAMGGETHARSVSTAKHDGRLSRRDLPSAPWSAKPLEPGAVPGPVVKAWRQAENRNRCAPLAPRDLGVGKDAAPRVSKLHGGWAVEFDKPGSPGISRDGTPCKECGRASFGIAGTALSPEELVDVDDRASAPAPSFKDGSSAKFELPQGDGAATAATLTISGQDCVYQVWSFLGEQHARRLVRELRFVSVRDRAPSDRVAKLF